MTSTLLSEELTRVTVAVTKATGGVAAGVVLHRNYHLYCIGSIWLPDYPDSSVRQAIRYVSAQALQYVDETTKIVVFRSNNLQFKKNKEIRAHTELIAKPSGLEVRFIYDSCRRKIMDAMNLANDAIARKTTIWDDDL